MNKKALVMKNIIIAIIALIVLGVILYVTVGPAFRKAVDEFFNKTEEIKEKSEEYRPGEIISNFNLYITKNNYFKNLIIDEIV